MDQTIRIGTRESQLALWQAQEVRKQLEALGYTTVLIPVSSRGDKDLHTPIYEMGITGVFTRTLDTALLQGKIDIAVHSMKDVPTALPQGIVQAAVLKRGNTADILVAKAEVDFNTRCTIATSSLRRKAQWLHRFPHHEVVPLRGNVNTRLKKLEEADWQGAIFAKTGLERIRVLPDQYIELDWMLPAPAQGAIVVVAKEDNQFAVKAAQKLNNEEAYKTTFAERMFLRILEGGCSAPVGVLAKIVGDQLFLQGNLCTPDGKTMLKIEKSCSVKAYDTIGQEAAREILSQGGESLMKTIRLFIDKQRRS